MYSRYAIYHCPSDADFAAFGADWLGWDVETGSDRPVPEAHEAVVARPRKYGFHATMKAPFRLVEGETFDRLRGAVAELAGAQKAVRLEALEVQRLGRFLALVPSQASADLQALGFACVEQLDGFRAAMTETERARRKPERLSAAQREMLERWGYPYVGEEFRFHMTLTGPLGDELDTVKAEAEAAVSGLAIRPYLLDRICLCGERADGRFEVIDGFALAG